MYGCFEPHGEGTNHWCQDGSNYWHQCFVNVWKTQIPIIYYGSNGVDSTPLTKVLTGTKDRDN